MSTTLKAVGLSTCAILGLAMALSASPAEASDSYVRDAIANNKVQICECDF